MAKVTRRGQHVRVALAPEEQVVLAGLAREVAAMVAPDPPPESGPPADPLAAMVGISADATTPEDPALHRLLPDAYADPEGAAEFRRLTDTELRQGKARRLRSLAADADRASEPLQLPVERVDEWVQAINDIRLVLGVRLQIAVDDSRRWVDEIGPDDPRQPLVPAYDWLSMLQELLLDALAAPGN